ncbi:MAG TPA: helix-turn-helix domain-containing protein [Candidatus Aphodovivens avistercoris]|nr:helix-turn-helix domain-containing protein [Candidatus Aphodovivens avistercoris]
MGLTLRIIIHELEKRYGEVLAGKLSLRRQCADVRLWGAGGCEPGLLYVVSADEAPEGAPEAEEGAPAPVVLAVGAGARPAEGRLALSGCASHLEAFAFLQGVFARYRAWLEAMDRSLIRNEGLQGLFDVSEEFLLNNVIVVDPALKLLAYTKGIIPEDDPVTMELIRHGYHTEENIRKFQLNQRFEPWAKQNGFIINDTKAICNYTTVVFSFKAADSFSLIVVMACNNADPQPWLLDTFMMFLVRVAYYSMRDYTGGTPSGSAFNAFAHDILDGALTDEGEIEERRRYLGLPADGPFCLYCIDIAGSKHLSARIVTDVARSIAPAKAMLRGSEVVVLCFSCHGAGCPIGVPTESCPTGGSNVYKRLEAVLIEYGLEAGRSVRFDALPFLPTALEQAQIALRTGRLFTQPRSDEKRRGPASPRPRIFGFDDWYFEHGVMSVARGHRDLLTSLRGCRQLLRIRAYDEQHGTDNLAFLRAYLRYERRTTVVAEKLHMHRNNVKYRVDRLNELFGVDTDCDDERLELSIAYRILDALER